MSIIITGLEMPTERESFNLTIKYNGLVFDTETGIQVAEAHEVPPHGRMIDADALEHIIGQFSLNWEYGQGVSDCWDALIAAPTIIEAEEVDNG